MTIQAECGGCGQVYLVDESKAGRSGKCKECGATFQVPSEAQDQGHKAVAKNH